MANELKTWKCEGGHVMGMVSRNGSGIRQLLLYREAVSYEAPGEGTSANDVDVIATVEGFVADVRCSLCGRIRTWVPGQEAMAHLIAQMANQKRNVTSS